MAGVTGSVIESNKAALALAGRNLNAVLAAGRIGAKEGIDKVALELLDKIVTKLSEPGTGTLYYYDVSAKTGHPYLSKTPPVTAHNRGTHIASAPGHPPAAWLGIYRRSWSWSPFGLKGPWASVQTADERGPLLEFGTKNMMPRPHVTPSVVEMTSVITAVIAAEIVKRQMATIEGLWGSKL